LNLARHEGYHVIRDSLLLNFPEIPFPLPHSGIEHQEFLLVQRFEELIHEVRVAAGFLMDQCCQRNVPLELRVERVGYELACRGLVERVKEDLVDRRPAGPNLLQGKRQRVICAYLLVPVRAENKEVPILGIRHQELHQFE